jgi:ribulose-phosphate 3-epimerase
MCIALTKVTTTDNNILNALRHDMQRGFTMFMQRYREPVYWHIRRLVVSHDDAEDVTQEVFVPNISFGFPVINALAKECKKPLDVHLMIVHPENYIKQVAATGAMMMNVHYEACVHLHRTIQEIHAAGMKAGVTLNPSTPVSMIVDIINDVDMVLLMSVNPGFGGQKFIPHSVEKTRQLRQLIDSTGSNALIQIDGGVNGETAKLLVEAGADVLVSGNYVFKSEDPIATIHGLKTIRR